MTLEQFVKMFSESKKEMSLASSEALLKNMLNTEFPMIFCQQHFSRHEYDTRLARRTACMELIRIFHDAPPWEDYRELIAKSEWKCMQRILKHMTSGAYKRKDGEYIGRSDVWFMDMWAAYHYIFTRLPGKIPFITPWKIFNNLLGQTADSIEQYRRI